jgi:serine/threonine protein kinase
MVSESENTATITDFGFAALGEFISTGKEDGTPTSPTHFGVEDALAAGGVTLQARMKGFTPKYRCPEIRDLLQSQVLNSMVTHKSDMWAFGVLLMELFAGGTQGLRSGRGEDAPLLLDLLIRNSMSGEPISEHARNNASFRIIPPESIIALLRDLFQVDPAARPPSMSSVTKRLSLSLQEAVEGHAAVIPEGSNVQDLLGPPGGVELDTQPDYSKVGRLHMWLGKALFFKGGDKREQAISEYRQGVEVLEKSPADRNSSSMALFRWYLGSALLESLRDKQQQSSASNTMVGKGGASSDYSTFSSGLSALDVDSSVLSQSEPTLEEQQDHRLAMEALQHLRVAVGISPDHPKYRFGLALACKATGDVEEAIRQLEIAVSNESSSEAKAECLYQLGLLHRDCLDPRRACEYLKEAVKLDKSGSTHYTEALEAVSGRSYRNRRASTGEAAERPRFKVGDVVCGHKIESIDNIGSTPPWFQGGGGRVSTYRVSSCLRSGYGGSEPASLCCIQFNDVLTTSRTAVDRPSTSSSVGSFGNITYQGSYTGGRRPMSVSSATSGKSSRAPSRYDHHYAEVLLAAAKGALLGPTNAYVMSVQMLSSGPGPNELTIVTDVLQRSRSTLQQVLEGPLYSGTAAVAVERMLRLSSQIAAGIAHCHNRGIILQDIKPHDIMVSPSWDAKLRPDLAHARFDQRWLKRCQAKGSAHAGITRERRRLPSMSSQPRGASDAKAPSVETPNSSHRTADDEDLEEQADNGSNLDLSVVQAEFSSVRMDYQSPEIAAHVMHRTQAGAHWQGSRRPFYVRPATSDIWVWALITLQMFADQIWGVGRGEEGRSALDHLVQRHTGVESWTTAEVLQWLATISGMEGPEVAREITAFKITGKQLLIPSRGRDIMEKLGLFISRGDLAELLWEALTTQVQRWPVPAGLVDILRKCLAQNASDRFQHMSDVCDSLQQALGIERRRSSEVTPTGKGPALEAKEQAAEVISRAASCLKSQDQIEKAEEHYLLSLHVCPTHIEAHVGLGAVYSHPHFESHDAACASYMRAAELMGSSDPRYRRIMAAAKDAERKSNFYQSAAVMSQLSGRYRPEALRRHSSMASSVSSLSTEDNGVWRPVGKSSSNSTVSGQVLGYGLEIGRHRGTV